MTLKKSVLLAALWYIVDSQIYYKYRDVRALAIIPGQRFRSNEFSYSRSSIEFTEPSKKCSSVFFSFFWRIYYARTDRQIYTPIYFPPKSLILSLNRAFYSADFLVREYNTTVQMVSALVPLKTTRPRPIFMWIVTRIVVIVIVFYVLPSQ